MVSWGLLPSIAKQPDHSRTHTLHSLSHLGQIRASNRPQHASFLDRRGNLSTQRKPTETQVKHANPRGPQADLGVEPWTFLLRGDCAIFYAVSICFSQLCNLSFWLYLFVIFCWFFWWPCLWRPACRVWSVSNIHTWVDPDLWGVTGWVRDLSLLNENHICHVSTLMHHLLKL